MHETSRPTAAPPHSHSLPIPNVGELVARSCRAHGAQPAVTSAARSISYAELEQRSNRLANALLAQGLARGDRVRSEEHTSELQSPCNLVCRLLLEKKKNNQ